MVCAISGSLNLGQCLGAEVNYVVINRIHFTSLSYICFRDRVSRASGAHTGPGLQSIPQGDSLGGAEVHRASAVDLRDEV